MVVPFSAVGLRQKLFGNITGRKDIMSPYWPNLYHFSRLSGYTLFTILLLTIHLGGGWSSWSLSNSNPFVRLIAYNIAPAVLLGSVFSRIRLVILPVLQGYLPDHRVQIVQNEVILGRSRHVQM